MKIWHKHKPTFEYEQLEPRIVQHSAWVGHRHFCYDYIQHYEPPVVVELGTHWGASFFSMCQAVKDAVLPTSCYALDTWLGDAHSGQYGHEVYEQVSSIASTLYPTFTHLLRATFDEALDQFENGSIDLLHIDGFHSYEAVKHDYETWLPKLATHGVVWFHDISIHAFGFGVWKLWYELKEQHPSLQFEHSGGLGILFPKGINKHYDVLEKQWIELKPGYEK
ncbi:class I SAM-dependent methyltransferase [Paenibacillus sp. SC116]|uniref:class I SAM-dependent methyltransferase n=1 Tax=Paenibacillus sp. SC116 TaxID=2968986 RepID=UPI00215B6DE4|nr:class I SAM-dependent methyltransferase [Paenibacillus sp. SC116]MCR8845363.1 class I SAM-dependent methyltransferase [Paenibacillus sp. SC116]